MNFIAELRKRNVFRVLAAYLVGAWLMLQVVGFIADAAEMPAWTDTLVLILVLAGLPIVAVAAWALELTPEGIKPSGTQTETEVRPMGPLDIVLSIAVVAVVGLFAWQMVARPGPAASAVTEAFEEPLAQQAQSIAVMPFIAISNEDEDRFLGDGLAEELLNVLAQFPELRVAGRTSSFAFRDEAEDIPAIGEALNVSHVLEGSIRRVADQVRVTAQLVRVSDGFHMWSGTYDRPFEDIQEVQDDIVNSIAQTLTIRLGLSSYDLTQSDSVNPAAYEQFLEGRVLWAQRDFEDNREAAINAFQTAVDIDPDFGAAWAALGRALTYSQAQEGFSREEHCIRTGEAGENAMRLDPDNPEALIAMSNWHRDCAFDWVTAQELSDRAVEMAPNAAYTHYDSALMNEVTGNWAQMVRSFRRAMALDPLNRTIALNAVQRYALMGRTGEARRLIAQMDLPESQANQQEMLIAFFERDFERVRERWGIQQEFILAADPNHTEFVAAASNFVAAFAAAFEGDSEEVASRLPQVAADVESELIEPTSVADILSANHNYREAAETYRALLEDGTIQPNDALFISNQPLDEALRCQPDFRRMWEQENLRELAEIRRGNGATEKLPLSGLECDEHVAEVTE